MHRLITSTAVACCLVASISASWLYGAAQKSAKQTYPIPDHGDLIVNLPAKWTGALQAAPGLPGATIEFDSDKPQAVQVLVTALPNGSLGHLKVSTAAVKKLVEQQGTALLATAKETKLTVESLKGTNATGYFYNLTDNAPKPGSFELMTQGLINVGDLLCSFTVLYHTPNQAERSTGLEIISSMSESAAAAGPASQPAGMSLDGPANAKWKLVLAANGFVVQQDDWSEDRKSRQFMAASQETGLILSVFMEPARKPGNGSVVRDVYWDRAKQSPMKKEGIKLSTLKANNAGTVEYIVPDIDGVPVNDKNVNVYIAHNGVWLDIHLSKTPFTAADQHLFDDVVNQIRFVAK